MSKLLPLSIIILNHRRDDRFKNAIASAQFADEVLIIDYQSQANYQKLKTEFNFKLIKNQQLLTNFAQARNEALQETKHDWVFFLDSDEEIRNIDQAKIETYLKNKKIDGVYVKRHDLYQGQLLYHGEAKQNKILRMAKKQLMSWQRPVHEVSQVKGKTTKSHILLLHHAHQDLAEFITDVTRYAGQVAVYQRSFHLWQLIFYPPLKFIYNLIFKLGILDGFCGLDYALVMSLHSLAVRATQYELNQNEN